MASFKDIFTRLALSFIAFAAFSTLSALPSSAETIFVKVKFAEGVPLQDQPAPIDRSISWLPTARDVSATSNFTSLDLLNEEARVSLLDLGSRVDVSIYYREVEEKPLFADSLGEERHFVGFKVTWTRPR